jgi:hypothetical protein
VLQGIVEAELENIRVGNFEVAVLDLIEVGNPQVVDGLRIDPVLAYFALFLHLHFLLNLDLP